VPTFQQLEGYPTVLSLVPVTPKTNFNSKRVIILKYKSNDLSNFLNFCKKITDKENQNPILYLIFFYGLTTSCFFN
jgi:hypothetical protein